MSSISISNTVTALSSLKNTTTNLQNSTSFNSKENKALQAVLNEIDNISQVLKDNSSNNTISNSLLTNIDSWSKDVAAALQNSTPNIALLNNYINAGNVLMAQLQPQSQIGLLLESLNKLNSAVYTDINNTSSSAALNLSVFAQQVSNLLINLNAVQGSSTPLPPTLIADINAWAQNSLTELQSNNPDKTKIFIPNLENRTLLINKAVDLINQLNTLIPDALPLDASDTPSNITLYSKALISNVNVYLVMMSLVSAANVIVNNATQIESGMNKMFQEMTQKLQDFLGFITKVNKAFKDAAGQVSYINNDASQGGLQFAWQTTVKTGTDTDVEASKNKDKEGKTISSTPWNTKAITMQAAIDLVGKTSDINMYQLLTLKNDPAKNPNLPELKPLWTADQILASGGKDLAGAGSKIAFQVYSGNDPSSFITQFASTGAPPAPAVSPEVAKAQALLTAAEKNKATAQTAFDTAQSKAAEFSNAFEITQTANPASQEYFNAIRIITSSNFTTVNNAVVSASEQLAAAEDSVNQATANLVAAQNAPQSAPVVPKQNYYMNQNDMNNMLNSIGSEMQKFTGGNMAEQNDKAFDSPIALQGLSQAVTSAISQMQSQSSASVSKLGISNQALTSAVSNFVSVNTNLMNMMMKLFSIG